MNNDLIKRNIAISYAVSGLVRRIDEEDWIRVSEVKHSINEVPTVSQDCSECKRFDFPYVTINVEFTEEEKQEIIEKVQKGFLVLSDEEASVRPQGEWLHPYITNIACECSNCHIQMPITDYFNFCPNCGARMKGGAENE